jgi:hypothetical protein
MSCLSLNNTLCVNTHGSFECKCSHGLKNVSNACVDIDECSIGKNQNICTNGSQCKNTFGSLFTAANHHMAKYVVGMSSSRYFFNSWPSRTLSGGWGARGYGNLPSNTRFWVYIRDQSANCWNP